jgi:hypothetical protein
LYVAFHIKYEGHFFEGEWSMTIHSAGVSGKGNRINSQMAAKLKEKRTSITTVRDQFLSFATFPTPLLSHYPLPLRAPRTPVEGKPNDAILNFLKLHILLFFCYFVSSYLTSGQCYEGNIFLVALPSVSHCAASLGWLVLAAQ